VHQSEVARLVALLASLLLVVPVARTARSLVLASAFLVEFLSGGAARPLTALTDAPRREPLGVSGVAADRYRPPGARPVPPLVLVHGVTSEGKDDPRLATAAALLARLHFDVAVPTIPGLTRGRLRPEDVAPVLATLGAREAPTVVVAVSLGAGPALLAAADGRVRDRVTTVVTLGGYASARELLRFYLTGRYAFREVEGRVTHDPRLVELFVEANRDLVDEAARALLRTPVDARPAVFARLVSPELARLLDALSPARVAADITARLVLIHGRADPAVPYTESLRLAALRPDIATLVLVGSVEHVESGPAGGWWREPVDFLRLLAVTYALAARD
jgi:pimeloyl-ACP methyl ester carboxylesterase